MQQYMTGLSPMPHTPGPDVGGMVMQGINTYLGQKRQSEQDTKMKAMIDALGGNNNSMFGGQGGGMNSWAGYGQPTQAMPPMMGLD